MYQLLEHADGRFFVASKQRIIKEFPTKDDAENWLEEFEWLQYLLTYQD